MKSNELWLIWLSQFFKKLLPYFFGNTLEQTLTHFEAAVDSDDVEKAVASRSDAASIASERAGSGFL